MKKLITSIAKNRWFKVAVAFVVAYALVLSVARLHPVRQSKQGDALDIFTSQLDERVPELMKTYQIPGASMALVKDSEIVWSQAFGHADLKTNRKMTTDTVCRVQSISKSVTAWGVMNLVEQGKIGLDDSVSDYLKKWKLPASEFSQEKMTVRQLLSHTAGMPLGDIMTRFAPWEDMPSLLDKLTEEALINNEPGESFSYSNTGYNLLELLIEEVTGLSFSEYMEQIFVALNMNNSTFVWNAAFDPPVPTGYNLKGKPIPVYVYPEKASGGLFSTAEDIAKFVIAGMPNARQDILTADSINHLYKPMATDLGMYNLVFDAYGLGYYIEYIPSGQVAISHGGQGTGWMTHFHAVPETGDAIIILTNSQRSWPFIAYVLSDWAEWNGFSYVGMETILIGQKVMWGVIGFIWFAVFLQLFNLIERVIYKKNSFNPLSRDFHFIRIVQIGLFLALSTLLIWCISQPYLTISSVFPRASAWLGVSVFALALVLFVSALFPAVDRRNFN